MAPVSEYSALEEDEDVVYVFSGPGLEQTKASKFKYRKSRAIPLCCSILVILVLSALVLFHAIDLGTIFSFRPDEPTSLATGAKSGLNRTQSRHRTPGKGTVSPFVRRIRQKTCPILSESETIRWSMNRRTGGMEHDSVERGITSGYFENLDENVEVERLFQNVSNAQKSFDTWLANSSSDVGQYLKQVLKMDVPSRFEDEFQNPCWYASVESSNKTLRCLPYFFLIGFPKCATTDLYYRMAMHPHVLLSFAKESFWWTTRRFLGIDCSTESCFKSKSQFLPFYLTQFEKASNCMQTTSDDNPAIKVPFVTGDASTSTIWDNRFWRQLPGNEGADEPRVLVAHHIRHYLPKAKIIVMVRNPVDRLFSDYLYFWRKTKPPSPEDFHNKVISGINMTKECFANKTQRTCVYDKSKERVRLRLGLYSVYIRDWLDVYPMEQIHVIKAEDYATGQKETLIKLFEFLELEALPEVAFQNITDQPITNSKREWGVEFSMSEETRTILTDFYDPYNRQLSELLDDDRFLWQDT